MKILHVVEPFSSGITTFIISLTQSLPYHQHTVFHGGRVTVDNLESVKMRFPKYVNFQKWRFAVRPLNPLFDFFAFITLFSHILLNKYDVIHLHSAKAGFLGRLVGWFYRGHKIIYTPNGASFLRKDVSQFKRRVFQKLEKLAARMSGKVICCGQSESEAYSEIGVKNTFINNGVMVLPLIDSKGKSVKIRITSVGLLTYQKNPAMFNEIANHFKRDSRVQFCWIGGGDLRSMIDETNIEVTGWLSSKGVEDNLADSDVYLSTSLWEGQPFAVLEAMNKGKCLVLKNCVGNKDLVQEGVNGHLFDSVNQAVSIIKKLIDNPSLIDNFGSSSKQICAEFHNQANMGALYAKEYEEIN